MNSNPKVSVIVPVYNMERHLRQCLDSILAQTLARIEIICVDDGSTDGSLAILREYEAADARIKVITQANAGAGAARNRGLELAKGEYLSFLDSDDFFEPQMLEKAYQKAVEAKAQITVFRSDQYYDDLDEFKQVRWTLHEKALPPYRPMTHRTFTDNVFRVFVGWAWDKLYEREFVMKSGVRFQEIRSTNDMLFVFTTLVLAERIEIVDEVLAHQRRNQKESISNTREKSWQCFYEALCALKENLIRHGLFYELEQDYINYALHFSLWHVNTLTGEKKKVLFEKLKREWFAALGIADKPERYFYNQKEYGEYLQIRDRDFADVFGSCIQQKG